MEILMIILYVLFLIGLYYFVMKRMKHLSYEHMNNTWLKSLGRWYEIIRRRLVVVLVLMFVVSVYLIFTFFENDILL